MKRPNREQILHAQCLVIHSLLDYIDDQLDLTIYNEEDIYKVLRTIKQGVHVLMGMMDKCIDETEEPKSVCY